MRIKPGFNLRVVCGENVIVAEGKANIDFNHIIRLNETASVIWKAVIGKEFTIEDMVAALIEEYEVDMDTAATDCKNLVNSWSEAGMLVGTEFKEQEQNQSTATTKPAEAKPHTSEENKESFIGGIIKRVKKLFG